MENEEEKVARTWSDIRSELLEMEKLIAKMKGRRELSPELSLAKTEVQKARMLSGKCIGFQTGSQTPYSDNKKTVKDIEPRFEDSTTSIFFVPFSETLIGQIDDYRQALEKIKEDIMFMVETSAFSIESYSSNLFVDHIYMSLTLARNWLGEELHTIRKDSK